MANTFLGDIQTFAGNYAPRGFAECNGQLLPISQNQALFSILGTTFGGDGRTTFGLPNFNGRTPIHPGNGPGISPIQLGQNIGTDFHTLTPAHIPQHSHAIGDVTLPTSNVAATQTSPTGNYPAQPEEFAYGDAVDAKASITAPTETGTTGSAQSVDNRKPSLELTVIIALVGTFPSRN